MKKITFIDSKKLKELSELTKENIDKSFFIRNILLKKGKVVGRDSSK